MQKLPSFPMDVPALQLDSPSDSLPIPALCFLLLHPFISITV